MFSHAKEVKNSPMARPRKPNSTKSNVVPMKSEDAGNVAVAEPEPQPEPEAPETPFDPPAEPQAAAPVVPKRTLTFWQKVHSIPKADWGSRAFIYVYCLEPICDLRQGGEKKYLVRLQAPQEDENFLMADYGSGKYRLTLVNRKPAADKQDAVDTLDVEIYNPKFPPKIPQEVWMNDRRNDRWKALLPKEVPALPPTPLGAVSEAFQTFTDIRKSMRDEMAPPPPPAAPPPAPPVNTMSDTLNLVNTIMTMKADNPMSEIYRQEMQSLREEMKSEREENRRLQREMREAAEKRAAAPATGETFETIIDKFEKIAPKLQGLLGLGGEKVTDIVHGRRREWWQELAISAAPQIAPGLNAIMGAAANYFTMPRGSLGQPPPPSGQAALPPPHAPAGPPDPNEQLRQSVGAYLQINLPTVRKYFEGFVKGLPSENDPESKMDGEDFAIWVNQGNPQILKDARSLGSANLVDMFQRAPTIWVNIAPFEKQFRQFLDQVLSFAPDEVEEPEEGQPVDLTEEE